MSVYFILFFSFWFFFILCFGFDTFFFPYLYTLYVKIMWNKNRMKRKKKLFFSCPVILLISIWNRTSSNTDISLLVFFYAFSLTVYVLFLCIFFLPSTIFVYVVDFNCRNCWTACVFVAVSRVFRPLKKEYRTLRCYRWKSLFQCLFVLSFFVFSSFLLFFFYFNQKSFFFHSPPLHYSIFNVIYYICSGHFKPKQMWKKNRIYYFDKMMTLITFSKSEQFTNYKWLKRI